MPQFSISYYNFFQTGTLKEHLKTPWKIEGITQPAITCPKLTTETLEHLSLTLNIFHTLF